MHDSTAAGRMMEAKAGHLSFDILVQKKLKLEKMEKKKEKKKRRKEIRLQSVFRETWLIGIDFCCVAQNMSNFFVIKYLRFLFCRVC